MSKIRFFSFILLITSVLWAGTIDLDALFDYEDQDVPTYIVQDNTPPYNEIEDSETTLGRVLFYDKQLSLDGSIACASCHMQEHAFSDPGILSIGFEGGFTGRHSMRLVNERFTEEDAFFWDERAENLEEQTTMPIQDHVEMGFSGIDGQPGIDSLLDRISSIGYYQSLFQFAYGDLEVTEERVSESLAQFVRSIQSFDSRFDEGFAQVANLAQPFPNFNAQENQGKNLFVLPPPAGGAGCQGCHRAPEFDIDPVMGNNGVIGVAGDPGAIDLNNTRAPSLRDVFNLDGELNSPLMHDGSFLTMEAVIDHYDDISVDPDNDNLDPRLLGPGGVGQQLNLTQAEKAALVAFLKTLTGTDIYSNEMWSDPFDEEGGLNVVGGTVSLEERMAEWSVYPNPTKGQLRIDTEHAIRMVRLFTISGVMLQEHPASDYPLVLDLGGLSEGLYLLEIQFQDGQRAVERLIKE